MKISRDELKQIICEEIEAAVKERFVVNETRHIGSAVYQSNRPYDRSLETPIKASGFPTLIHVGQSLSLVRRELLKIYGPLQDRIKDINGQQQGIFSDREVAARLIKASRDIKRTIEVINPEIAKFKNLGEQFKGSYNQRLIDLNKMFKSIDKMIKDLGVRENGDEDKETVIERLFPNELDRLELAYNFAKRIVLVRTTPEINPKNAISMLPPIPRGVTYKKPQGKQQ